VFKGLIYLQLNTSFGRAHIGKVLIIITLTVTANVQPILGLAVCSLGSNPIARVALVEVPSSTALLLRFIRTEVTFEF
jgi:hypothetical protein